MSVSTVVLEVEYVGLKLEIHISVSGVNQSDLVIATRVAFLKF